MNDDSLIRAMKEALGEPATPELERDLWPRMLERLGRPPVWITWLDWALLAAMAAWCRLFPEVVPALLYQL